MTSSLPANLTPEEMNILQIVCVMAWSDQELSEAERDLMISTLAKLFAESEAEAAGLEQVLQQNAQLSLAKLDELVPKLQSEDDRELALKLGYMVIRASGTATEPSINSKEKIAYRRLVELLNLDEDTIEKTEWAADADLKENGKLAYAVSSRVGQFFGRLR